jgi:hypothetical protein
LFGDNKKKIWIKLFTDSKPMLESISSKHQVEEKLLRNQYHLHEGCTVEWSGEVFLIVRQREGHGGGHHD